MLNHIVAISCVLRTLSACVLLGRLIQMKSLFFAFVLGFVATLVGIFFWGFVASFLLEVLHLPLPGGDNGLIYIQYFFVGPLLFSAGFKLGGTLPAKKLTSRPRDTTR